MRMSRYLSVPISFALLISACAASSFALTPKRAALNPAFIEYQKTLKSAASFSSSVLKTSALSTSSAGYGYVPSPVNWDRFSGISFGVPSSAARQSSSLPVSYSVKNTLPAAKNQVFGNCWAYAAMAATSSNLVKKGIYSSPVDLSEWYITYYCYQAESADKPGFTTQDSVYDDGGDDWRAVALLSRGTGSLLESNCADPATKAKAYNPGIKTRNFKIKNAYCLGNLNVRENVLSNDRAALVKNAIMNYGAVSIGMRQIQNDSRILSGDAYYNPYAAGRTNHSVAIVGWDDNYAISNFGYKPKNPGAWLVRNSWGADWGNEGYFYVSYEEPSLHDGVAYDTVKEPGNERIYQYDPLGCATSYGYDTKKEGFANIFKAEGNDKLTSVAFYVFNPNTSYTINIYTNCSADKPNSGTLAASKTVTLSIPGYNTVDLNSTVQLTKGVRFSVVVVADVTNASSADFTMVIPVEDYEAGYSEKATANAGEGWISNDGVTFEDITKQDGEEKTSICIKAFATKESSGGSGGGGGCNAGVSVLSLLLIVPLFRRKIR